MKITREETSPLEVVLNVELESDDVEPYLARSYKQVVNRLQIPGFRRGKAPRVLVENYMGREAMVRESLDLIVRESLDKAIEEEKLEIFGEPDVDVAEIDPVSFKAVLSLEPIVDLGDFRNLRLEPEPVEVTEEQVDAALEEIRYDAAPWEPSDGPVKFGNLITLDVDGTIDGKKVADDRGVEFMPSLDNPRPFPGFSVYLEGMKKEESKEFTLEVPEDYPDTAIASKQCRFSVRVLEIKEKLLAELDDEFAKGVGEGYDGLEALRASIRQNLTEHAERAAQRAFQERSLEEVIKGASVEVSELTTNREIDHILEERLRATQGRQVDMDTYLKDVGKSREELREELRPAAKGRLTHFLTVRKLSQQEGIEISPEEIDAEVERLTSGSSESMQSLRQALSSESSRVSIRNAILTRKVLECVGQIVLSGASETEAPDEGAALSIEDEEPSEREGGAEESTPPSSEHAEATQSEEEGGNPVDDQSL